MKYVVLTYRDIYNVNIGDYIQSLAASQYFDNKKCVYQNRDELGLYDGEEAKVIMNGWFTYKPKTWIPSSKLMPLFVSFHLNSECVSSVLDKSCLDYLKKHSPIGCRDSYTMNVLNTHGIDAYYSGCLTMTLGRTYMSSNRSDDVVVVDPYSYMPNGNGIGEIIFTFFQFLFHIYPVLRLLKKYKADNKFTISLSKIGIGRLLILTKTYLLLKNIFDKELIWKARYITHLYMHNEYKSDEDRFARAKQLIDIYSRAKFVVTSRIHCAFPCLGLGTPVAYIQDIMATEKSSCRLWDVGDLLNVIKVRKGKLVSTFMTGNISANTIFFNKSFYKSKVYKLISDCEKFVREDD